MIWFFFVLDTYTILAYAMELWKGWSHGAFAILPPSHPYCLFANLFFIWGKIRSFFVHLMLFCVIPCNKYNTCCLNRWICCQIILSICQAHSFYCGTILSKIPLFEDRLWFSGHWHEWWIKVSLGLGDFRNHIPHWSIGI